MIKSWHKKKVCNGLKLLKNPLLLVQCVCVH